VKGHLLRDIPRGKRCPICKAARERARYANDPHRQALTSYAWHKAREAARQRDRNRCVYAGNGDCYGQLEVHHLISVRRGGAPFALDNLVTVCRAHHEVIKEAQRKAARLEKGILSSARLTPSRFFREKSVKN
jgi:5-methylcytosine-specific restriction endonuclease McrA